MKLIAYYLPQFHEIPENNEMWGEGFTEWTNVKKAKPLFDGHNQPIEPLDDNYYNLLDINVMRWQTSIAKKYGIYGFCFYHYWYNGHMLLQKPIENYLNDTSIDFPFCICWANHNWTTGWADHDFRVIYQQDYSDRNDWDEHFKYLLPYLNDKRYIRINGNPLIVLYEAAEIPEINALLERWQDLAKTNGFNKLEFAFQSVLGDEIIGFDDSHFTYDIEYQPQYVRELVLKKGEKKRRNIIHFKKMIAKLINYQGKNKNKKEYTAMVVDYDDAWKKAIDMGPVSKKSIPGAFVRMDTTPRIQNRGFVTQGMTPEKFYHYLKKLIEKTRDVYKKDMIFVFAWNEWAEGGYLEPDKTWGYGALEAIQQALEDTNEFPHEES